MEKSGIQRVYAPALIIIIVAGAYLRLKNITSQGLLRWDEGFFLIDALDLSYVNQFAKPIHKLLIRVGFEIFGVHDYAGALMSGITGLLTVIIVFLIGYKLYNKVVGLIAASLVCFSYNHIYFSRLSHAQADSTFFVALAILAYVSYRFSPNSSNLKTRYLAVCGTSLSLAFMTHPNIAPFVVFFPLAEAIFVLDSLKKAKKFAELKPLLLLCFSMGIPIILMEIGSRLFVDGEFNSYLGQVFTHGSWKVMGLKTVQGAYGDYQFFFKEIRRWEGSLKLILSIIAFLSALAFAIIKRNDKKAWFILALAAFPFAFWTIENSMGDTDRVYTSLSIGINLLVAYPAYHILDGFLLSLSKRSMARATYGMASLVLTVTLVLILWHNVAEATSLLKKKSYVSNLAAQIKAICPGPIFMPEHPIINPSLSYYFLESNRRIVINDPNDSKALYKQSGPRCFLVPAYAPSNRQTYDEWFNFLVNYTDKTRIVLSGNGKVKPVIDFGDFAVYDLGRIVKEGD